MSAPFDSFSGGMGLKCVSCGFENSEGMKFCGMCGKAIVAPVVSQDEARSRYCVECGRMMPWNVSVCQYCGHDYRKPLKDPSKDYLVVGGVLTTMAGVFSLVFTTIILSPMGNLSFENAALAGVIYACGFLGIMGGMLALTRNQFPFAILGAACAVMGPAFFFGIPGLVLIAKSSRYFKDESGSGP